MRYLIITLLILSPATFADEAAPCKEVIDAYEEALQADEKVLEMKDLIISDQDKLIVNLRDQRNEAIKQSGSSVMDYVWPFLAGAAAATVLIGIRR